MSERSKASGVIVSYLLMGLICLIEYPGMAPDITLADAGDLTNRMLPTHPTIVVCNEEDAAKYVQRLDAFFEKIAGGGKRPLVISYNDFYGVEKNKTITHISQDTQNVSFVSFGFDRPKTCFAKEFPFYITMKWFFPYPKPYSYTVMKKCQILVSHTGQKILQVRHKGRLSIVLMPDQTLRQYMVVTKNPEGDDNCFNRAMLYLAGMPYDLLNFDNIDSENYAIPIDVIKPFVQPAYEKYWDDDWDACHETPDFRCFKEREKRIEGRIEETARRLGRMRQSAQ